MRSTRARGKKIWSFDPGVNRDEAYSGSYDVVNRGVAVWEEAWIVYRTCHVQPRSRDESLEYAPLRTSLWTLMISSRLEPSFPVAATYKLRRFSPEPVVDLDDEDYSKREG